MRFVVRFYKECTISLFNAKCTISLFNAIFFVC